MTHRLSKLLLLGALAMLWLPAISFSWHSISKQKWKSKPLVGVQMAAPPASLTIEHLTDGSFQRSVAQFIGPSIPFYADAVRLHNQLFYTALRLPTSRHIIVGKDDYLLNPVYNNAYCRRDLKKSTKDFASWALMLREIQDKIEARGQIFIYVLTPSKIEHLPDTLPFGFPCPSKDRQQFLAAAVAHLEDQGVNYLDATASVHETFPKYGYEPFPVGGIHWTDLAVYPSVLAIIRAINTGKGKAVIDPYEITVEEAKHPTSIDRDFASLLNLLWEPAARRTAQISVASAVPPHCPAPVSIIAVGGSFFTSLGTGLSVAPCPPKVAQLTYFVIDTRHFNGGLLSVEQRPNYELLLSSDVVLVEENAGILLNTNHIPALHNYLHTGSLTVRGLY